MLEQFNDTQCEYPKEALIQELFEQQARQRPQATAVEFEGERLSYAELNAKANQLAHHLRSLGVRPDDRVALCLERSVEHGDCDPRARSKRAERTCHWTRAIPPSDCSTC